MRVTRRNLLQTTLLGAASSALAFRREGRPRILLRGSWHSINIGDIAHTIGTINLITTYLPEVEIILWPKNVTDGVEEVIRRRFPNLQIIQEEHEVKAAFEECDFFLHGSAPNLVGQAELQRWSDETDKPYGVFGIGLGTAGAMGRRGSTAGIGESF